MLHERSPVLRLLTWYLYLQRTILYDPSRKLFATPHTQAQVVHRETTSTMRKTPSIPVLLKVTVSVTNFVALMHCAGLMDERPVVVKIPQAIIETALAKTTPAGLLPTFPDAEVESRNLRSSLRNPKVS